MKLMNTNSQDRDKQNEIGELRHSFGDYFWQLKN